METCEPVSISCPKCGTRYRMEAEQVFHGKRTSCRKCQETLQITGREARSKPVQEDEILHWLRLSERED